MDTAVEPGVRKRAAARNGVRSQRRVSWSAEVLDEEKRKQSASQVSLPWYLVLLYITILGSFLGISLYFFQYLPEPVTNGNPNQFHASRARSHMEDLTSLGTRYVGWKSNEVHAKALLINKLEEIKKSASLEVNIEISVQTTSGTFYVDFLSGITHIYQNVTNIVARISRRGSSAENAFMINAHYDSALGSPGASDDAVSCGTMLEVLRCLASEPRPLENTDSAIIFLFNGAEETMLQASHGFITQHPWAKTIRAFLNLEAAGAGGKEIVFQTGPGHPWLARMYSRVVPYPHASVLAQEVFQAGVIPSDTDFRIFRDHGKIPGIDAAYYVNGYVYHTEYDIPSAIPDGSIQRAGDNTLSLLRAVVKSPYLSNPEADFGGKDVFFDVLGLMGVVYSETVAMVINISIVLVVFGLMALELEWDNVKFSAKPTPRQLLVSEGVLVLSWLAAILAVMAVSGVLTVAGCSMTWYSQPCLVVPLYLVPALFASAAVHQVYMIKMSSSYSAESLERAAFLSIQLLCTVGLMILTSLHICSAFMLLIPVLSHILFRSILLDRIVSRELPGGHFMRQVAHAVCCACGCGLPGMIQLQLVLSLMGMFMPLMGRAGTKVPPDLVVGGLVGVLGTLMTPYCLCVLVYSTSRSLKKWVWSAVLVVFTVTLVAALAGVFQPYSVQDKKYPMPKRLFSLHTDRRFHAMDGSITSEDSQVFVYPFDYLGVTPIDRYTPLFKKARKYECEGLYCRTPTYIPVANLVEPYVLPAESKNGLEASKIKLVSKEEMSEQSRNFTFNAKFHPRTTLVLGLSEGLTLEAWSLDSFIPTPNPCPGSYVKRGCYFMFQSKGFGDGNFDFWLKIQGVAKNSESLRLLVSTHYLDPPENSSPDLQRVSRDLPDWVSGISWTACVDEWIF